MALSKKVDGLLKTVEKSEAATPKPAKSEPAKRAPVKKKTAGVSATDQVLRLINKRTKKGKLIEKRHHERLKHNTIITLETLQIGVYENNRMVNYSETGLYFMSDHFLLPGAEVFVLVENFPHSQTGSYKCHQVKIKWGKKLKNSPYAYGYGAQYVDPRNEQNSLETDSDQIKDLRKYPRKDYAKPSIFGFENKSYDGLIKNISRNGCFIENREFLNIGQILELVIPGTIFTDSNMLQVEVVRLSPSGVGVNFKNIIKKDSKK